MGGDPGRRLEGAKIDLVIYFARQLSDQTDGDRGGGRQKHFWPRASTALCTPPLSRIAGGAHRLKTISEKITYLQNA